MLKMKSYLHYTKRVGAGEGSVDDALGTKERAPEHPKICVGAMCRSTKCPF